MLLYIYYTLFNFICELASLFHSNFHINNSLHDHLHHCKSFSHHYSHCQLNKSRGFMIGEKNEKQKVFYS
uniref:Uncharacterized protein n=1 Tax=Tetranychus urticae TaxID=32264 RepID=T1JZI9_TETUR